MYNYMLGTVIEIFPRYIVLDVHNIGYEIFVAHSEDYDYMESIKIYLHQIVREDEIFFVGFRDKEEKDVFLRLITVKGIGPKTAIAALGATRVDRLKTAIETGDVKYLKGLPGIGAKSAQQIILDLKGHLINPDNLLANNAVESVVEALKSLGFKSGEIEKALAKTDQSLPESEIIRHCLQILRK